MTYLGALGVVVVTNNVNMTYAGGQVQWGKANRDSRLTVLRLRAANADGKVRL